MPATNMRTVTLKGISKSFPGVRALEEIDLSFRSGEIHAVVGENGAGKSTLMKILAGDYSKDSGEIQLFGHVEELGSPRRAQQAGIGMIYQELTLLPNRSIAQNIMLGREPGLGLVNRRLMIQAARDNLAQLGLNLNPMAMVSSLPIAIRQMVEIAKALSLKAKILIFDEPTSSLTETETRILLKMIKSLRERDMTLIYISHRLEEVFEIADRITVLRDGRLIATRLVDETNPSEVVKMMVGRELGDMYSKNATPKAEVLLEVDKLSGRDFRNCSLALHRGEILGIYGLVGAGRTEFARALLGLDPASFGKIMIEGRWIRRLSIRTAIARGLVYVPEDRKTQGLFLGLSVRKNLTINILRSLSRWGLLNFRRLGKTARELIRRLNIRPSEPLKRTRNLSGGNQQKVVIAKWLSVEPGILVLDEPTRGIDVGSKVEIYALIDKLAAEGVGVIIISSELPEILGISDRILVMKAGELVGELPREDATQDDIIHLAAGAEQ